MELSRHAGSLKCHHCAKRDQFVSHGFVYKKQTGAKMLIVGKRIFCSDRYGRSGCGATLRLYLASSIPDLVYNAAILMTFITALFAGLTIQKAYLNATHCDDPRNAYRWLNKLQFSQNYYRVFLGSPNTLYDKQFNNRALRLKTLLPILKRLFSKISQTSCERYQILMQTSFI